MVNESISSAARSVLSRRAPTRAMGLLVKYFATQSQTIARRPRRNLAADSALRPRGRRSDLAALALLGPRLLLPDGHTELSSPAWVTEATSLSILRQLSGLTSLRSFLSEY